MPTHRISKMIWSFLVTTPFLVLLLNHSVVRTVSGLAFYQGGGDGGGGGRNILGIGGGGGGIVGGGGVGGMGRRGDAAGLGIHTTPPLRGDKPRFFLDTADIDQWYDLMPTGIFHGITTNPLILERGKQPCTIQNLRYLARLALYDSELSLMCNEFMCQTWGQSVEEMVETGLAIADACPTNDRIVIKVPTTIQGLKAASILIRYHHVRICLTACYNHQQALLAKNVGAEYIAPYVGRMTDKAGKDGMQECIKMKRLIDNLTYSSVYNNADGSDRRLIGLGESSQRIGRMSKTQIMNDPTVPNYGDYYDNGADEMSLTTQPKTTRILVASLRTTSQIVDLTMAGLDTFTFSPDLTRQLFADIFTSKAVDEFEQSAQRNQFLPDE